MIPVFGVGSGHFPDVALVETSEAVYVKSVLGELSWPVAVGLGVLALARPVMSMVGVMDQLGKPLAPVLVTLAISAVWVAVVGLDRVRHPVLTLGCAGLVYGVLAIVLSAIFSPLLNGQLQGPLATPGGVGVFATLVVNALWGLVVGMVAAGVQHLRGNREGRLHRG